MIQFNLLPAVKIEYIRARRTKRLIIMSAIAIGSASLFIVAILFLVVGVMQKQHLKDLDKDISSLSAKLQETPNLDKILTVQNQLNNLTTLHDQKPVASRLFSYIGQLTPAQATIATLNINYPDSTISITGAADSINTINTFVDTLKFTTYPIKDQKEEKSAFSKVVLAGFGRDARGASYEITFSYDPAIFDSKNDIKLTVPKKITTRSETEKPAELFQPNSNPGEGQ